MQPNPITALAAPSRPKTASERVRELLPDIEAAINRGVPHKAILAALADDGFEMSSDVFRTVLARARASARKAGKPPDKEPRHQTQTQRPGQAAPDRKTEPKIQPASDTFDWQAIRDSKPNW
ncbi:hypothetical protein LH427_01965 [Laribacter hongkongensis]|nr:hypothetical protein [Laribacter hongkongensis]MCG8991788.1 hypothetical protein [Laribacter hongkongensis]MCG8998713.1 hypothetical protein [Laribacter hongkongensis]MCG9000213.1 hypothetical protein [Laribacter hongkongensis]MCG9004430.1 hypothetical protein [Laribacter hongkongensis]MCG9014669.1 hypothetical protein [Laribacter hongkongensis]